METKRKTPVQLEALDSMYSGDKLNLFPSLIIKYVKQKIEFK